MSDTAPVPQLRSPLHDFSLPARAKPIDATCGVWASEVQMLGYISLRGQADNAKFAHACADGLGLAPPAAPCTFVQAGALSVFWLSPDEWMIAVPRGEHAAVLNRLIESLAGIKSQVADNSGGYTQVLVQGRNARDVLSHCTVYDLDHLSDGRIVGTTFGKTSVYLRRAGEGYCLLLRRSFADYIWRFLERASEPYGFGVARLNRRTGDAS